MKTMQLVPAMEQGGVERGVVETSRALTAAGWENVVVSVGGRLAAEIELDGARHVTLDLKSKNPLTYFARAARLERLLEAERPDVVCAHSRVPAWLFVRANRRLGLPWITFAHGANSVSRYSRVMTYGDLTVTPSRYVADYLKANYPIAEERIRVIPRAIETGRFDVNALDRDFMAAQRVAWKTEGAFVVMGLGRITQLKGYDVLIRAVAELVRSGARDRLGRPFRLVLVGEAEALRKDVALRLEALVAELGVGESVVFAGNQLKVAECLALADAVVSSNVRKPEAFGRSMAEALAMDRPVVAKAFGGALDVVRDGVDGVLVRTGEDPLSAAHDFARAIAEVAAREFSGLRESALRRFDFRTMTDRTLSVYKELAK